LVLPVEAEVRGQQALLGGIAGAPAAPEIQEQPAQAQHGNDLLQIGAEETVRRHIFRSRKRGALVAAEGREGQHRKVLAVDETHADRGLAGRFPGHSRLGIDALGEVDELDELVALLRVDRGRLGGLEDAGVLAEIWGSPGHTGCRRHLTTQVLGHLVLDGE
jgi:hypothetical protein